MWEHGWSLIDKELTEMSSCRLNICMYIFHSIPPCVARHCEIASKSGVVLFWDELAGGCTTTKYSVGKHWTQGSSMYKYNIVYYTHITKYKMSCLSGIRVQFHTCHLQAAYLISWHILSLSDLWRSDFTSTWEPLGWWVPGRSKKEGIFLISTETNDT
jgi:hypothetical protein